MIDITQASKISMRALGTKLEACGKPEVRLCKEAIMADINKLDTIKEARDNETTSRNVDSTKKYLKMLLKHTDKPIELKWTTSTKNAVSIPLALRSVPLFNIEASDYVMLEQDSEIVYVDYSRVLELITYEASYRDVYCLTLDDVEQKMYDKDISSSGLTSVELLDDIIPSDILLEASKYKVEDSRYLAFGADRLFDYFQTEVKRRGKYLDYVSWIESSEASMMLLILNDVLTRQSIAKLPCELLTVGKRHLVFKAKKGTDITQIADDAAVRIFGRRFIVKPKITIL